MNSLKKLAGQTVIYGLPTIVGRLLNYFLVPLYTYLFPPREYAVVTELYAYVSLFMVILTYGMETAFFRFSQKTEDKNRVYNTSVISLLISSSLFILFISLFSGSISENLGYKLHSEYFIWFGIILGLDALCSIPFARLRDQNKAFRFAWIKSTNIAINILMNLFFIVLCPQLMKSDSVWLRNVISLIYNPSIGVGYVFISNLIATVITMILLLPEVFQIRLQLDKKLWKEMFFYAFPIMIWGMAGIVNETFDRILMKHLIADRAVAEFQLGVYGACYKISILMTLFVQTFRFAAEPFFFQHSKNKDARQTYADVMKYFIIVCSLIFLGVTMYQDIVMHFVGKDYRVGAPVVPILLMANLFLGVFYNLSIWYKLTDQTRYGAWISTFGAALTLVLNFILVPITGFMGAAWATFWCYLSIMVISYFLGQKHYPIPYDIKRIAFYFGLALVLYFASRFLNIEHTFVKYSIHTLFVLFYLSIVFVMERKLQIKPTSA